MLKYLPKTAFDKCNEQIKLCIICLKILRYFNLNCRLKYFYRIQIAINSYGIIKYKYL